MHIKNLNIIAFFALILCLGLSSCIYEDFPNEPGKENTPNAGNYALTFSITLDRMGGTRAGYNPNEDLESYIDPEKFRVFFFDSEDKFLFESKSRWMKQLSSNSTSSTWFVSVPFFSYGNDTEEYDWNWDGIREAMTSAKFKIAIMTNVPKTEYFPDLEDNTNGGAHWFDNTGPHWTVDNSVCGGSDVKTVFDLHHSQYDPIYESKGVPTSTGAQAYNGENFYQFVMGKEEVIYNGEVIEKPMMSAVTGWVDHNGEVSGQANTKNKDPNGWGFRRALNLSESHPIPMYGIQEFNPISEEAWPVGTTFDLSRKDESDVPIDLPISLLRSAVKLELVIPKSLGTVNFVTLWYSNIYSRVLPMDNWTPTDQIWENDHENGCEWKDILNHGRVCTASDGDPSTMRLYQERICWFYGVWHEAGKWDFPGQQHNYVMTELNNSRYKFPKIFNSCIQRNNTVYIDEKSDFSDNENYHFIVYTGERNVNDPSNLGRMGYITNDAQAPVIFWMFNINGYRYIAPIIDYSKRNDNRGNLNPVYQIDPEPYSFAAKETPIHWGSPKSNNNLAYGSNNYIHAVHIINDETQTQTNSGQSRTFNYRVLPNDMLPWPLLRNHVYKLTITNKTTRSGNTPPSLMDLGIVSEDLHSKSIRFSKKSAEEIPVKEDTKTTAKKASLSFKK